MAISGRIGRIAGNPCLSARIASSWLCPDTHARLLSPRKETYPTSGVFRAHNAEPRFPNCNRDPHTASSCRFGSLSDALGAAQCKYRSRCLAMQCLWARIGKWLTSCADQQLILVHEGSSCPGTLFHMPTTGSGWSALMILKMAL